MSEQNNEKFVKVRLNSLYSQEPIPFDLYVLINNKQIHYLRAGDKLTQEKLEKFENKAPDNFYIVEERRSDYKKYVHHNLRRSEIPPKEKAIILRESSSTLIEELFERPDIRRALTESKEIIDQFVELMGNEPSAMAHLIGLSSHDVYTDTHPLDVGIYSLGLAQAAGYD